MLPAVRHTRNFARIATARESETTKIERERTDKACQQLRVRAYQSIYLLVLIHQHRPPEFLRSLPRSDMHCLEEFYGLFLDANRL